GTGSHHHHSPGKGVGADFKTDSIHIPSGSQSRARQRCLRQDCRRAAQPNPHGPLLSGTTSSLASLGLASNATTSHSYLTRQRHLLQLATPCRL
ncbi:hypothetical protein E2320_002228, partial [Naja naja]